MCGTPHCGCKLQRSASADSLKAVSLLTVKETEMAGKFEIYKDSAGEFRFRLKASNGQKILASEGYGSRASCDNGIESVRENAPSDSRYVRKETQSGKYMFNLRAANNQVIGTSESYETAAGRDNGIESVKNTAPSAVVEDLTDK